MPAGRQNEKSSIGPGISGALGVLICGLVLNPTKGQLATTTPAGADHADTDPVTTQPVDWPESRYAPMALDSPYATGDWLGLRTALEDMGIGTQFFYNNTSQWVAKGGLNTGSHNGATIDWFVTFDFDRMKLIEGGKMLVHVRRQWGEGVNPYTGSLWQVADDLDGDRDLHIDQLWYEQQIVKNVLALTVGFLDYQTIVDRNAYANTEDKQFLSQPLDNNPLLPLNIGLGATLVFRPVPWFSFLSGIGDANSILFKPGFSTAFHGPAQFVWFNEAGFSFDVPNLIGTGKLPGNYRFGMVYDPRPRSVFAPPGTDPSLVKARGDDVGFYANFDQKLYAEAEHADQGLGWFFRYGFRHGDVNLIQNFWSTGLEYRGLIRTRDDDVIGAGVYQSIPSRIYNDKVNRWAEAETGFECYYSIQVTKWLAITPDFQYIGSPGIGSGVDDVIVLGLRTRISF